MNVYPYHPRLMELLQSTPDPGGGHRWLFQVALHMRHYHSQAQIFRVLRECTSSWERQVPDREIQTAVFRAFQLPKLAEGANPLPKAQAWPAFNPSYTAHVCTKAPAGTFPLTPHPTMTAADVLMDLWGHQALLCCGPSTEQAKVRTRAEWVELGADTLQFIVPSQMTAQWGVSSDLRESPRCLANTGPRQFLVVECDNIGLEDQAKVLAVLAKGLPLTMIVHSAGKSLHGWFYVAGIPDVNLRAFFRIACMLGADSHTWTRCQWVRMPGGTRYTKDGLALRQSILHWNPAAIGTRCQD